MRELKITTQMTYKRAQLAAANRGAMYPDHDAIIEGDTVTVSPGVATGGSPTVNAN